MSLINEALKKAQRLRREEAAGVAEQEVAVPSVTRIAKRGRARTARMIVLLASGAAMLIVLSTTLTVYLINRTPAPPARPAPASTGSRPVKPSATETPESTAGEPNLLLPAATSQETNPVVVVTPPLDPAMPSPSSTPGADPSTPTLVITQLPPGLAKPDERIVVFVEALKVAGIRSSGNESRVLMNERVYRVNDVIDRGLGVKLVGVAANALIFADPNGATYQKQF